MSVVTDHSSILAVETTPVPTSIDTSTGANLLDKIRTFIMPFLMITIVGISLTFLIRRQMSQFFQFILISVAVLALVYSPEIIAGLARVVAGFFSG
jgi:uncharacterized membrane protein